MPRKKPKIVDKAPSDINKSSNVEKSLTKVDKIPKDIDISSNTRKSFTKSSEAVKCSRKSVTQVIDLLNEVKDKSLRKNPARKCKDNFSAVILPYYPTYVAIQIRNALLTHNWVAAARLLRILLNYPKSSLIKLQKFIWRSFFLIVQHNPEDCSLRMERLQGVCSKLFKDKDFRMALSIPEIDSTEDNL